ncbi:MAG TPA: cysteine synthase family protein [Thermoanaerobaculia bacterium]|nr:cysteine synthase family protein [Thermoanaerobaculia bacterium]
METYENILATLGDTPLVELRRFHPEGALLAAKVESFNPGQSVKDRIGIAMIEAAEEAGDLQPGGIIVEPTSGNTGVGLAIAAILRGYTMVCTAADKIPAEKVALLEAHGVEVHLCPTHVEADDPRSYYKTAERIRDERGAFLPYQYWNQANPQAHYRTTGPEVWRQTDGRITHWVAGVGTGGTISGTAKYLKEQNPDVTVVGVDTVGSVYAYHLEHGEMPPAEEIHQYLIDGIGEDFLPGSVWMDLIDEMITIDDRSAYRAVFELCQKEGIFTGTSGAAAALAARQVARRLPEDAVVVTLFPDSGERYLSKLNEEWMREKGLLDEGETLASLGQDG